MEVLNLKIFEDLGNSPNEALIEEYRKERKPFKISMVLRHQFSCEECGHKEAEAVVYFENPNLELNGEADKMSLWGLPSGWFASTKRSCLHSSVNHGKPLPIGKASYILKYGE